MSGIRKKIEVLLSAISFAEEGEFETAKSMLSTRKKVLLAVRNGRLDNKTCTYARNTSRRIASGLDLLVVTAREEEELNPTLQSFLTQLEADAIPYAVHKRAGCLKQAILQHMKAADNVLFVVIDSEDSLNANCQTRDKRLTDAWRRLQCPLVVVADGLKA